MLFAKHVQPVASGGGGGLTFTLAGVPSSSIYTPGEYLIDMLYNSYTFADAGIFDPDPPTFGPPVTGMGFVNGFGMEPYLGLVDLAAIVVSAEITDGTTINGMQLGQYIDSVTINGVPIPGTIYPDEYYPMFEATDPDLLSYVPGVETYVTLEITLSEIPDPPAGWTWIHTGA